MPRWNHREKPDYRHLRDVTDEAALVNSIRSPTYGARTDYGLLAGFQARLLAMWGDRDFLALDELVPAHEDVRARDPGFFGHGRNWRGAFLHDTVGNLVGWGLRLEILEEVKEIGTRDGAVVVKARAFRMVRREPIFERMGNGRWRRIDAVPGRSERGAAAKERYRVRYAKSIAALVRSHVGRLCDAGAIVPEVWFSRFPEQFAWLRGLAVHISDARSTFEEAHHGMHLADQKVWLSRLECLTHRNPPTLLASQVAIPDEDAEALGGLV